jgi:L-threonylcarbamoyladenylate synthase
MVLLLNLEDAGQRRDVVANVLAGLRLGEPVAIPTEFGYIFVCEAINPFAIKRLKAARNDHGSIGYPILFSNLDQLMKFAIPIPETLKNVLEEHWSGLLTLEIEKLNKNWDTGDGCHGKTFYARSTCDPFILEILNSYGPLTITSASAKGWPSLETPESIEEHFSGKIHSVIGNGQIAQAGPTTVISHEAGDILILREGAIGQKQLEQQFPEINFRSLTEISEHAK